ncbi:MAG: hypothetical protein Q4A21_01410 [bacterium]|nr:hypothetical protein [bacterium]
MDKSFTFSLSLSFSENLARELAKDLIAGGSAIEESQDDENTISFYHPDGGFFGIRMYFDKTTSKIKLYAMHDTSGGGTVIAGITFELIDNSLAVEYDEPLYSKYRYINESISDRAKRFIEVKVEKAMTSFHSGNEEAEL